MSETRWRKDFDGVWRQVERSALMERQGVQLPDDWSPAEDDSYTLRDDDERYYCRWSADIRADLAKYLRRERWYDWA